MQTRKDGTHDILPVAGGLAAVPDHAGMPVMWPRESDGKMRRDGPDAARGQPRHPVDERGRVHGAPELSPDADQRIAAKRSVVLTAIEEQRRWSRSRANHDRLRGQDKASCLAAGTSFLSICLHIVFWRQPADPARCAGTAEADFPSVFNDFLGGRRNVRRWRSRRFYAVASISTPEPYTPIFDLVSTV